MSKAVKVAAAEIRAAKKWLERRKITAKQVSPRNFAKAAKLMDKNFKETLQTLADAQTGGQ